MVPQLAVATALVALAACPRLGPPRPVVALAGPARVAVVPFRTGSPPGSEGGAGTEAVPADAGPAAARMLAAPLAEAGQAAGDPGRARRARARSDTRAPHRPRA